MSKQDPSSSTPPPIDPQRIWQRVRDEPIHEARAAAILVWITSGVELLVFGCCATVTGILALVDLKQLQQQVGPEQRMPEQEFQSLLHAQPQMGPAALVLLIGMVLPALGLVVLGFAVQRGRRGLIRFTQALMIGQILLTGLLLVVAVASTLAGVYPLAGLLADLVLLGGLLYLLIRAILRLQRAAAAVEQANQSGSVSQDPPNPL